MPCMSLCLSPARTLATPTGPEGGAPVLVRGTWGQGEGVSLTLARQSHRFRALLEPRRGHQSDQEQASPGAHGGLSGPRVRCGASACSPQPHGLVTLGNHCVSWTVPL